MGGRRLGTAALLIVLGCLGAASSADGWIYWGHFAYGTGVGRAGLDGTQANESFVPAPVGTYAFSRGIAVDSTYLYWGTHGLGTTPEHSFEPPRIGRALLSGASPEYSFTGATGQGITGLGVSATHLYWTADNQDTSEIGRTPVIGGQQFQSFGSVFGQPNPLTCGVATDGTYVYFANRGTSSIGRATLANFASGEGVEGQWIQLPASASEAVFPCGVAISGPYIYWGIYQVSINGVLSAGTTIGRAVRADKSEATDSFAGGGNTITGLATDGTFLYSSNYGDGAPGHGSIGRANISGGGGSPDFITGLNAPYGIAVDTGGPAAAPPVSNVPAGYVPPLVVGCSGCGGGSTPGSSVAPDFSRVWGTHATFAPASWSTPLYAVAKSASAAKGTVFNYILSKAGTVKIAIDGTLPGRRVG